MIAMGISFGRNAGTTSYTYSAKLGKRLGKKGGGDSAGGRSLLAFMGRGVDRQELSPAEAGQAAESLRTAAGKLRGADRSTAEQIARDAQEAADSGRPWTIG